MTQTKRRRRKKMKRAKFKHIFDLWPSSAAKVKSFEFCRLALANLKALRQDEGLVPISICRATQTNTNKGALRQTNK